jgi:hypothetical protein
MTKPIIKIHNAETGEVIEREMTKAEADQFALDSSAAIARQTNEAEKAAEKTALLAKLGITDDEAKLLLS